MAVDAELRELGRERLPQGDVSLGFRIPTFRSGGRNPSARPRPLTIMLRNGNCRGHPGCRPTDLAEITFEPLCEE